MDWKIFYGDGTTFSSEDGGPEMAPTRDVQVILQDCRRHITEIVSGGDCYVWWGGYWRAVDHFGFFDYLVEKGFWKAILLGRTTSQEEYSEIVSRANIEKTGWLARERKTTSD